MTCFDLHHSIVAQAAGLGLLLGLKVNLSSQSQPFKGDVKPLKANFCKSVFIAIEKFTLVFFLKTTDTLFYQE